MKLFGILSRRFLTRERSLVGRNLCLMMTASAATYLIYNYLSQQYHPRLTFPRLAEALPMDNKS